MGADLASPPVAQAADRAARHIPALDGLRGIAVLAVLFFHTDSSPLAGGYLGVDLFFVLSGFLITGILLRQAQGRGRVALGEFWLRRARRLAPPLLALLIVLGVVRWGLSPEVRDAWRADMFAALTYTTNWWEILQADDYFAQFGPASPLLHTWSLAIEEQFYLLFAVFMAFMARRGIRHRPLLVMLLIATVGSIGSMLWAMAASDVTWGYYATIPRLQALLIGGMLAILLSQARVSGAAHRLRTPVGVAGFLGMLILMTGVWPESFGPLYTVVALCAAGVIWAATGDGWLASALAWRPLVMLGLISYGVYLWHWPIFLWLQGEEASVAVQAGAFLLTVLVSTLSFFVVERPVRQGRFTRLPVAAQWGTYAGVAVVIVALAMLPGRATAPVAVSDESVAELTEGLQPSPNPSAVPLPSQQWPADRHVPRAILTNGDSTILALSAQFPHDVYAGRQVGGAALLGCGFSQLPYYPSGDVLPPAAECATWEDEWRKWNGLIDAQVVVTGVSGWDAVNRIQDGQLVVPGDLLFDRSFAVAFESGLRIASQGGKVPVYVLGMPCFAAKKDAQFRNDPLRREGLNRKAQDVIERVPNTHYVDTSAFTCDDGFAISKQRAKQLYLDGVHWSPKGGRAMWSLLLQQWQSDGLMDPKG